FGVLLAGGIPSALYPPVRLGKIEEWKRRSSRMLRVLGCQAVLTNKSLHSLLAYPVSESNPPIGSFTVASILEDSTREGEVPAIHSQDTAFIQFSSGTTGSPKPVALSHGNILQNAEFILGNLPGNPKEARCVSWLPVYHDMGLIGALISSMMAQAELTLIPPELFLARPKNWLEALTRMKGSISVAPNFAYSLCCHRISESESADLDLSHWKVALCGAEPIQPETLRLFSERFRPFGFDPKAFTPAYGLAEATLAVTASPFGEGPTERSFDREKLEGSGTAVPADPGWTLVSVGRPIAGGQIDIRDENGNALEETKVGRIWVRGPQVMQGYFQDPTSTHQSLVNGWLDTGDRGFIFEKDLYLCGRYKDMIIVRGKNHDPAPLEECLDALPGIRKGCAVVFGELDAESGTERLVVLAEVRDSELSGTHEELMKAIQDRILKEYQLSVSEVVLLEPGTLPRTSSGKKQRQSAKQLWNQNALLPPENRPTWIYFRERVKGYLQQKFHGRKSAE
ncbi:MAG: fatty acyl-AMP ligase, partial [Deltaproteobacteria bacterium]|nr:fatty acyl-AMP ligase [Deltaproteobacteria bacterium]